MAHSLFVRIQGLTWRQLFIRKKQEEKYWWKSLYEERYHEVKDLFQQLPNSAHVVNSQSMTSSLSVSGAAARVGTARVLVMDDQNGNHFSLNCLHHALMLTSD